MLDRAVNKRWEICPSCNKYEPQLLYSQSMLNVPVASGLINSWMEKWSGLSIQWSIHKINNLMVKLDLDLN